MDLSRLQLLIGDKVDILKNSKILVIGLGGVGSYAVESLCRSGIGNLTLVDYDVIDSSNLNRQLMTNQNNIGLYKTDIWKDRINLINKDCIVTILNQKLEENDINELITNFDFVIDACDTVSVKKELIRVCHKKNINLISSMGTGNKLDPTKLEITDITKTNYDPLAKIIRKMVKDEKIKGKVMVVSSSEQPFKTNSKTIASCSFVPSVAGLYCTSYVVNKLIGDKNEE